MIFLVTGVGLDDVIRPSASKRGLCTRSLGISYRISVPESLTESLGVNKLPRGLCAFKIEWQN